MALWTEAPQFSSAGIDAVVFGPGDIAQAHAPDEWVEERELLAARDAFVEIDHPVAGRFKYPQHLVSLTVTPPVPSRAPTLGEHNVEILGSLGISREEQQSLRATGVI